MSAHPQGEERLVAAEQVADDFFTAAPNYRTKERLVALVEKALRSSGPAVALLTRWCAVVGHSPDERLEQDLMDAYDDSRKWLILHHIDRRAP